MRGFVFDMDGTLAVGDPSGRGFILLPGVAEFIAHLRASNVPFVVFTNGTAHAPEHYVENLGLAGLRLEPHEMLTPSSVAADVFTTAGFRRVLILGDSGAGKPLTDAGLETIRPGEPGADDIDVVYVAWLPGFGLRDIGAAIDANLRGIDVWVSSDVPFFFTTKGRTHGVSGMIAGAIRNSTGRRPRIVGKPAAIAAAVVASRLGCAIEDVAIVGDDPRLEAAMAIRSGAVSVGVTTGLMDRAAWDAQPPARRAHFVIDRVDEITTRQLFPLVGRIERR